MGKGDASDAGCGQRGFSERQTCVSANRFSLIDGNRVVSLVSMLYTGGVLLVTGVFPFCVGSRLGEKI